MEEMSGKVQNASTHILQRQSREHAHTAVGQFKGQFKGAMDEMQHIMFKMQALTCCDANNEHARKGPVSSRVSSRGQWMKCL